MLHGSNAFSNPLFLDAALYGSDGFDSYFATLADVNGDGKLDLVVLNGCGQGGAGGVACSKPGNVAVMLGRGDGTFRPSVTYDTGYYASSLAVADVNGDGKPDIVVANGCVDSACSMPGQVSVLLGNGDGSFRPEQYHSGVYDAASVVVADLDGDGKPDLVATTNRVGSSTCINGGWVEVLMGEGNGTFQAPLAYCSGAEGANSLATADLNGDGKPDLVVGNFCATDDCYNGAVGVLLGNGDGTFQGAVVYAAGAEDTFSVALTDLNGDGYADIVAGNFCGSSCYDGITGIAILLGNGDGTFQPASVYEPGTVYGALAVADLNGDGKPDLVASNGGVGVLLGNGDGTFQPILEYSVPDGGPFEPVAIGDVNGDGKLDVVTANQSTAVAVLQGNGNGTLRAAATFPAGPYVVAAAAADVNGDGKIDLIVANTYGTADGTGRDSNGSAGVLLGNGDGTFQPVVLYDSGGEDTGAVVVADVNGDGKPDLMMTNYCGDLGEVENGCAYGDSTVSVLLGNGDGTFQPVVTYGSGDFGADALAVADINGDGKPDMIVVNSGLADEYYGGGSVAILLGNGDGTFQPAGGSGSGGWDADAVAVADVNGDGKPDLLVLNECQLSTTFMGGGDCSQGTIAVILGDGDGTFQPLVNFGTGAANAVSLAVGDVNGDGKPDLLVLNGCLDLSQCSSGGALAVLLGNGDGTFQGPLLTAIPANSVEAIALSDFNGDGKLDVATSEGVLLGNGDGTFQNFISFGVYSYDVAVGDFNGDGKPDLAAGGVTILLNITPAAPTTMTLVSSTDPSKAGKCATFIATVTSAAGTPTGKVRYMSGTTLLGTRWLNGGRAAFDVTDLPIGASNITATYEGSAKFRASSSGTVRQVVLGKTSTTLRSSPNPSVYGQSVTFTATVGSGEGVPADGDTVTFMVGKTVLGTGTLSGSTASFATSALKVGRSSVTAVYEGDSEFEGSTSKAVEQVVQRGP